MAVRRCQAAADAAEEIGRRVAAGFVPIISPAPGFVAYYAMHAGNDVVLSISIFQHDPMYELFLADEVGEMQQRTVQRDVGADRLCERTPRRSTSHERVTPVQEEGQCLLKRIRRLLFASTTRP